MSLRCPLCGKNKASEALFCENCSKKIRSDYEVGIPVKLNRAVDPIVLKQKEKSEYEVYNETDYATDNLKSEQDSAPVEKTQKTNGRKGKKRKLFLRVLLILVLLVGTFFVYNETIRKRKHERLAWDNALNVNTVDEYLAYMTSYPNSVHFLEAQARIISLKEEEASEWEKLKTTDDLADLYDFLLKYPVTPYRSLVELQIDSLSWMKALKVNRVEAYSDYLLQVEQGDIKGEYLTLAESRFNMLFQSYPIDEVELDSIRQTVKGYFNSLSSVDHDGILRYLAPVVDRFFESGRTSRERIIESLLIAVVCPQNDTLQFDVDSTSVQYEKTMKDSYLVNVPFTKTIVKDTSTTFLPGYIIHLELNPLFQITSVYEMKPNPGAL